MIIIAVNAEQTKQETYFSVTNLITHSFGTYKIAITIVSRTIC